MTFSEWLTNNWFSLLQSIGIIGGLAFTALSIRQATKARKVTDMLALTEQHRELWNEMYRNPQLSRVLSKQVDLLSSPLSVAEERFLNEVIVHFITGWQLAQSDSLITLDALKADIRGFFKLPIPNKVWNESKQDRDVNFVVLVENCIKN